MALINMGLNKSLELASMHMRVCGRATVGREWRGRIIKPTDTRLYYILRGEAQISWESEKMTLCEGSWYILPSGHTFDYICDNVLEHVFFHVRICSENLIDLIDQLGAPKKIPVDKKLSESIIELCDAEGTIAALELHNKLEHLLLFAIKRCGINLIQKEFSSSVNKAIRYVNDNLRMSLTIDELASVACVSRSTLTKHFRAELSCSVGEYVTERVMAKAERMLLTTSLSVREISELLGFSDQFYFSRIFKERFGVSPRMHRRLGVV